PVSLADAGLTVAAQPEPQAGLAGLAEPPAGAPPNSDAGTAVSVVAPEGALLGDEGDTPAGPSAAPASPVG
ncbi:MAG: hypothetical protein LBI84_05895, partial [Propionibacteriaceae bacterium]|nr:hypothetical protein [Propionibacteriaceae bacterium]